MTMLNLKPAAATGRWRAAEANRAPDDPGFAGSAGCERRTRWRWLAAPLNHDRNTTPTDTPTALPSCILNPPRSACRGHPQPGGVLWPRPQHPGWGCPGQKKQSDPKKFSPDLIG
jgi:hypothetical protein